MSETGLPTPERREVHREVHQSAQQTQFYTTIIEVEHREFLLFTASASPDGYAFAATDDLAARVSAKLNDGWNLLTLTGNSACLVRSGMASL